MKNIVHAIFLVSCINTHYTMQASNRSNQLSIDVYNSTRDKRAVVAIIAQAPRGAGLNIHAIEKNLTQYCNDYNHLHREKAECYLNNSYTDVLRLNNKTIGFANYYHILQAPGNAQKLIGTDTNLHTTGMIKMIAIDQSYHNRGYAQKMLNYGIAKLQEHGADRVFIAVNTSNEKAYNLYKKLGFEPYAQDSNTISLKKIL